MNKFVSKILCAGAALASSKFIIVEFYEDLGGYIYDLEKFFEANEIGNQSK